MAVICLVPKSVETPQVAALRRLLMLAISGRLMGSSITFREEGFEEDHLLTGLYDQYPAEAVRAAMRVSMLLTQIQEETRGRP